MNLDALLEVLAALPDEGNMSDVRRACPREMTPDGLWRALHAAGWIVGGRAGWRKTRDAAAYVPRK